MSYPVINLVESGKIIKEMMKIRGISVRDLKEYLGFNNTNSIYKWLRGDSLPNLENMYALSELLGVSVNDLLVQ